MPAADFTRLDQQAAPASIQNAAENFLDRDQDGFPDYMETNYKTNPADKGSFPNFLVDTDRDGIADFLEQMVDAAGIEVEATEARKLEIFKALAAQGVKWTSDRIRIQRGRGGRRRQGWRYPTQGRDQNARLRQGR